MHADTGGASIAPDKLLRAMLIQVFFPVRSERQLMEQVRYNLRYCWFIGLAIDDAVWDHSTFSRNRDRLLEPEVVENFFTEVMQPGRSALQAHHDGRQHRANRANDARGCARNSAINGTKHHGQRRQLPAAMSRSPIAFEK